MGLKDLNVRVKLPWKDDPTTARRLRKRIINSQDPEATAREIAKSLKR